MANLASLIVPIGANTDGLARGLTEAQAKVKAWGDNISGMLKSLAIAAPFALIGKAAFSSATKFDDAYRLIANTTGASGARLAGLETSFKSLYATSAASAEVIASALSVISQRTGLVGPALEIVTKGMMAMAKVAKSDVATIAPLMTRVMGDWSISASKSADSMKYLTSVSQQTGAQIPQLLERIVQYGAPMRQLGLGFEETAAMMAKWEAEGVNVETVMAGMRKAVSQFTKEGVDPATGLKAVLEGVKSGAYTAGQAMTLFGAKAGPDTLAAIKEGRFDELLTHQLQSVATAAKDSEVYPKSLATEWTLFRHKMDLALAPMGRMIMAAISVATPHLTTFGNVIQSVGAAFGELPGWAKIGVSAFALIIAVVPPLMVALASVTTAFGVMGVTAGGAWSLAAGPVGWAAGGVALGALLIVIDKATEKYRELAYNTGKAKELSELLAVTAAIQAKALKSAAESAGKHTISLGGLGKTTTHVNAEMAETVTAGEFIAQTFSNIVDIKLQERVDGATSSLRAGIKAWADATWAADEYGDSIKYIASEWTNLGIAVDGDDVIARMDEALRKKPKPYDPIEGLDPHLATRTVSPAQKQALQEVSTIFNDLSKGIAELVVEGGKFKDVLKGIGKQAEETFLRMILDKALTPLKSAMTAFVDWMFSGKGFAGLAQLGKDLVGIFKNVTGAIQGASQAGSDIAGAVGGTASAAGSVASAGAGAAGSVAGAAGSAAGAGATAIVGAVAGVVGAVSSIIGNFQMMGMNKSLDILVKHSLQLVMQGEVLDTFLRASINGIHDRLVEFRSIGMRVFTTDQPIDVLVRGGGLNAATAGGQFNFYNQGGNYMGAPEDLFNEFVRFLRARGVNV